MLRHRAALVTVASLGLYLLPQAANAYVYWGHSASGAIGRAALDGTGRTEAFIPAPSPAATSSAPALTTDGTSLYWLTSQTAFAGGPLSVGFARALVDASGLERPFGLTLASAVQGMTVDAAAIYTAGSSAGKGVVTRELKNGGGFTQFTSSGVGANPKTCGVAVDDTYVYFTNPGTFSIGRAKLNPFGGDVDGEFIKLPVGWQPCAIAVDATHLYWAVADVAGPPATLGTSIGRARKDGTDQQDTRWNTVPGSRITGLAVDARYAYWAADGVIGRAEKTSPAADTNWITGVSLPSGLAVDGAGPVPSVATPDIVTAPTGQPAAVSVPGGASSGASISACGSTACPPGGRPDFSRVWVTRTTFAPASRSTATSGPARVKTATARGTTFFFIVDRAAAVRVSIQRACRKTSGGKRCARAWTQSARLTRTTASAGTYSLPFTGRIRGKALAPGRYRAVFTATAKGATGAVSTVQFRVVGG